MAADKLSIQSSSNPFIGEIDHDEIKHIEIVGKGAFGTVYKAVWRNNYVAVKYIEQETERNAFAVEVRQLSRVSHKNIIALHGACTKQPNICLIMEYAEGGSLYNLLHCNLKTAYKAAHAMSWARQCAEGVAYLHAMRPKPLIHRDLKPPNLLLVDNARILKICDFGTVADKATLMTNNKGSAAWMAPEVFEGSTYTEKCDVFSWAIILWEILSREQPFKNIELAFGIMWTVHKGHRPPLLIGCPKPIENLMVGCWDPSPVNRPSMEYVVQVMRTLCEYFPGAEEPLEITKNDEAESYDDMNTLDQYTIDRNQSVYLTDKVFQSNNTAPSKSRQDVERSIREFGSSWSPQAVASTSNVNSNIPNGMNDSRNSTLSANLNANCNWNRAHSQISNSSAPIDSLLAPLTLDVDPNAWELQAPRIEIEPKPNNEQTASTESVSTTEARPNVVSLSTSMLTTGTSNISKPPTQSLPKATATTSKDTELPSTSAHVETNGDDDLDSMHIMLEPHLRPVPPDQNSELSKQIFEQHKQLANAYLKIHTEIAYVTKNHDELLATLDPKERKERLEYHRKLTERDELLQFHANLKRQLQLIRMNARPPPTNAQSLAPNEPHQFNRQLSNSSVMTNEEGWVIVPPQNESDV